MTMTMDPAATVASDPSGPVPGGGAVISTAPGAAGPGGQMGIVPAVFLTVGGAAAALVTLGIIFRAREAKLPPLRVDAAQALNVYFSWLLINGAVKVMAYRYHGHKLAQAYLLVA